MILKLYNLEEVLQRWDLALFEKLLLSCAGTSTSQRRECEAGTQTGEEGHTLTTGAISKGGQ